MLSKIEIRQKCRAQRNSLDPGVRATASDTICAELLCLDALRDAKTWFVYVSYASEVETHGLIRKLMAQGSTVTVPRISGFQMLPQQIRAWDELQLGEFGILAPAPGEAFEGAIDVCVCPGVAFSERGERLGAGRGYYDRYLAAHPPRLAIGLALECQIVAQVPMELHDRRMDFVITEKRIIRSAS